MRLAVIAANGRTGQVFVARALGAGHEIRGGVRGDKHSEPHPNLTYVNCDVTKPEEVRALLEGVDAVVSLIGHRWGSPKNLQTTVMQNLISAMQDAGIRRVVSLTGTGVRFPGDKVTLIDRFVNVFVRTLGHRRYKDGKEHAKLLQATDLDWTIIRVLRLEKIKPRPFQLTPNGPTRVLTCREEVATAILQVLEQRSFIKAAPIISPAS